MTRSRIDRDYGWTEEEHKQANHVENFAVSLEAFCKEYGFTLRAREMGDDTYIFIEGLKGPFTGTVTFYNDGEVSVRYYEHG